MSDWTDDQLLEFELGSLPDGEREALVAALDADVSLAARLAELREVMAAYAGVAAQTPPNAAERIDAIMDEVSRTNRFAHLAGTVAELLAIGRDEALTWLAGLDEPSNWGPGVLPGTRMWAVPTDREDLGVVWLKMPPGMEFPQHEHLGDETVLVVQGRYIDHEGRLHPPGSILREEPGTDHSFRIAEDGPEFICLALVGSGIRIGDAEVTRENLYGI